MPILGQEKLIEVRLPSSTDEDPAIVTVNVKIHAGQAEVLENSDDRADAVFELMATLVKSWNFTDAGGRQAEITPQSLRKLDVVDFKILTETVFESIKDQIEIKVVSDDEKKD